MKRLLIAICGYICGILFFLSLSLYFTVSDYYPNPDVGGSDIHWRYLSIGGGIHITATGLWGGNVVLFNGDVPYTGSVIYIADNKSTDNSQSVTGWTTHGIYFRDIPQTAGRKQTWWTLMFKLLYPIIVFGALTFLLLLRSWRSMFKDRRLAADAGGLQSK